MEKMTYKVFHFFCGSGGGALGFARGHARVGTTSATFRTLGGIDNNAAACADFHHLVGVPASCLDLFTRTQYEAFHGKPPPAGWEEVTHHDVREAARWENPDVVFLSPPCKGFSGLLSKASAKSCKYAALNELVVRSLRLAFDAWGDDPPSLIVLENVPRIASRGRSLLDEVIEVLDQAGYSVAETTHDCGELGGLAQHRKRFLLVARHREKVRPYVYEPTRQRVRGVGEVLNDLPLPDDSASGAMHRISRLTWKTWLRLALIPAGKDWRALENLDWERYRIQADWHANVFGVRSWDQPAGTVTTQGWPSTGSFSVADPRVNYGQHSGKLRVESYDQPTHTITGSDRVGSGALSIGGLRLEPGRFNNVFRLVRWNDPTPAVTSGGGPSSGGISVADPRPTRHLGDYQPYGVLPWTKASGTVTGQAAAGGGVYSVADPRLGRGLNADISGATKPRLPDDGDRPDPVPVIVALDGTWHRPFTTLELAALQGYPVTDADWQLEGASHSSWRERIGNSVPIPTAQAIANVFLTTLLSQTLGHQFQLSNDPIWVQRIAIAVAIDRPRVFVP